MALQLAAGLLAAIVGGLGVRAARESAREAEEERERNVATITQLSQLGIPLAQMPHAVVKGSKLKPEAIQGMIASGQIINQFREQSLRRAIGAFDKLGEQSSSENAGVELTPPAPSIGPGGEALAPIPFAPQVAQTPVRVQPGISADVEIGPGQKLHLSRGEVTQEAKERIEAGRAKLPGELAIQRQTAAKGEIEARVAKRKEELDLQQDAARKEVGALLTQAAQTDDPKSKLKFFEQALAIGAAHGLPELQTIEREQARLSDKIQGKLDLSKPDVAEYVKATGVNPVTNQPATPEQRRQATAAVSERESRIRDRQESVARILAGIQTKAMPEKLAIAGAMRTLTTEGKSVAAFYQRAEQIQGALKKVEENLNVFPSTMLGTPKAIAAYWTQTERGQKMRQIMQAVTQLQSLEPRAMAGEVGRIASQIEMQWREVLTDPRRVTRATAAGLVKSTRERLGDMTRANKAIVDRNANAARSVGIPQNLIDAFRKGDIGMLEMVTGGGLESGTLPPVLNLEDLK